MLRVAEIARRLGIHPQSVRDLIARGELPAVKVTPRAFRVREEDFDAFVRARSTAAASNPSTPSAQAHG